MPAVSYSEFDSILNRARGASSSSQQDAAFKSLQDFARSGSRPQQVKASKHLPEFYHICKDHRREIHDLILDLCEDENQDVRLVGYSALLDLSEREPSLRRKNADVLCQLLQIDAERELQAIRRALCRLIRIDPTITYSVINESMVSKGESGEERCFLMAAMVSFLSVGSVVTAASSNADIGTFQSNDSLGGKGAILEVSWAQQDEDADKSLLDGIARAIPFATVEEARLLVTDVAFSLLTEYISLAEGSTKILSRLLKKAQKASQDDASQVPSNMQNTLSWLSLCELAVAEPMSPFPSSQPESILPRASPLALLKAFNTWIIPSTLNMGDTSAQIGLLRILGTVLKASRVITQAIPNTFQIATLRPVIIETRNATVDLADRVFSAWMNSPGVEEDLGSCICITELLYAITERQKSPKWHITSKQISIVEDLRTHAAKHTMGTHWPQFRELVKVIDSLLTLAKGTPIDPRAIRAISSSSLGVRSDSFGSSSSSDSRKRNRKDLEIIDTSSNDVPSRSGDERVVKRQRTESHDLLTRITSMRVSKSSNDSPSIGQSSPLSRTTSSSSLPSHSPLKPVESTSFSIRGAASQKAGSENNNGPTSLHHRMSVVEEAAKPTPTHNTLPILARLGAVRPNPSTSFDESKKHGITFKPTTTVSPDLDNSIHQLLHGKAQANKPDMQRLSKKKASAPPSSTLLARLGGPGDGHSEAPKASIFDRLGMHSGSDNHGTSSKSRSR